MVRIWIKQYFPDQKKFVLSREKWIQMKNLLILLNQVHLLRMCEIFMLICWFFPHIDDWKRTAQFAEKIWLFFKENQNYLRIYRISNNKSLHCRIYNESSFNLFWFFCNLKQVKWYEKIIHWRSPTSWPSKL